MEAEDKNTFVRCHQRSLVLSGEMKTCQTGADHRTAALIAEGEEAGVGG